MNLEKLFSMQKELDERIVQKKGLEGQDLLPKKILALQVELGELANEWRGFKFWSEDQEPRNREIDNIFRADRHGPEVIITNPLIEEYVDCFHFTLSIGLETGFSIIKYSEEIKPLIKENITEQFISVNNSASHLRKFNNYKVYEVLFRKVLGLGEMLGFGREQIEQAYYEKNKENHSRQESGY